MTRRLAAIVIGLTAVVWFAYAVGVWFGWQLQPFLISVACLLSGTRVLGWAGDIWNDR